MAIRWFTALFGAFLLTLAPLAATAQTPPPAPADPNEEQATMREPPLLPQIELAPDDAAQILAEHPPANASRREYIEYLRARSERVSHDAYWTHIHKTCPDCVGGAGGMPLQIKDAGFQVEIYYDERVPASVFPDIPGAQPWELRHICGGALIAHDWVLTAAHCVDQAKLARGISARLGADDISGGTGISVKIDRVIRHPQYSETDMYDYDIALAHLVPDARSRDGFEIQQIALPQTALATDDKAVFAAGWGKVSDAGGLAVALLRRFDMDVLPQGQCVAMPGYGPEKIHADVLCAQRDLVKTCRGDSGGPLVLSTQPGPLGASHKRLQQTPRLIGIVSWNKSGCDQDSDWRPGVFTRVSSYLEWIKATIGAPAEPAEPVPVAGSLHRPAPATGLAARPRKRRFRVLPNGRRVPVSSSGRRRRWTADLREPYSAPSSAG